MRGTDRGTSTEGEGWSPLMVWLPHADDPLCGRARASFSGTKLRCKCEWFSLIAKDWLRDNRTSVQHLSVKASSNTFSRMTHRCVLHRLLIQICVQHYFNVYLRAGGLKKMHIYFFFYDYRITFNRFNQTQKQFHKNCCSVQFAKTIS